VHFYVYSSNLNFFLSFASTSSYLRPSPVYCDCQSETKRVTWYMCLFLSLTLRPGISSFLVTYAKDFIWSLFVTIEDLEKFCFVSMNDAQPQWSHIYSPHTVGKGHPPFHISQGIALKLLLFSVQLSYFFIVTENDHRLILYSNRMWLVIICVCRRNDNSIFDELSVQGPDMIAEVDFGADITGTFKTHFITVIFTIN
jgi:hypothetical protein